MKKFIFLFTLVLFFVSCSHDVITVSGGGNQGAVEPGKVAKSGIKDSSGKTMPHTEEICIVSSVNSEGVESDELPPDIPDSADSMRKGVFLPGRKIKLSPFVMGKFEVTQELYRSVMTGKSVFIGGTEYLLNENPSTCCEHPTNANYVMATDENPGNLPVDSLTWFDAVYFCNELSKKESLTQAYNIVVKEVAYKVDIKDENENIICSKYKIKDAEVQIIPGANGYRLPTEAEWEFAARGGDPEKDDWNYLFSGAPTGKNGDDNIAYDATINSGLDEVGWYIYNTCNSGGLTGTKGTAKTPGYSSHEVGLKKANALDLYDMSGNVCEWVFDYENPDPGVKDDVYMDSEGNVVDPVVDIPWTKELNGSTVTTKKRVYRGGMFYQTANMSSVFYRFVSVGSQPSASTGFRVCRSVK